MKQAANDIADNIRENIDLSTRVRELEEQLRASQQKVRDLEAEIAKPKPRKKLVPA